MAMVVDNVMLPDEIMEGSRFGPEFSTVILETPSGYEQRIQQWQFPRHKGQIGFGVRTLEQLLDLKAFFLARSGRARGFLFRDHRDYSVGRTSLGTGNGSLTRFNLVKRYSSGSVEMVRKLTRPVSGSVRVWVGGGELSSGWSLDSSGTITFASAPASTVEASCDFSVPVRFDTDFMDVTLEGVLGGWETIPIVEVRENA